MAGTLRILYIGDIMGRPGRQVIAQELPKLREKYKVDVVIAQAENVSHGKSMSTAHMRELQKAGVDGFSGGNHTIERPSIKELLAEPGEPVVAPLNQQGSEAGWGAKVLATDAGPVLMVSLLGTVFPAVVPASNPLAAIDTLLAQVSNQHFAAIIVNFHGDFSSEKRVIGYYLDGRVTAVIGDHWHVPTADAMILPDGTAHITDVGMCGTLHSSLGVTKEIIISRWRDGVKIKNDIAEGGPYQLNAALVTADAKTGLAKSIKPVNLVIEKLR
ncbi:MAG: TIGR00282 family metallophosphoesterase [Candidatus Saccharimonadales bacterium]